MWDDSSQQELANLRFTSLRDTYHLTYGNREITLKAFGLGTKITILDNALGRELGTVSCSFRGLYSVPNLVEWRDGGCLYIPPPVVQPIDGGRYCYRLVPRDERGSRLMRLEWAPNKFSLMPNLASATDRERCWVFPEDMKMKDPIFPLVSGIAWIAVLQLIWLDRSFG